MDKNERFEQWWKALGEIGEGRYKGIVRSAYMQGHKDGKEELDGSGSSRKRGHLPPPISSRETAV